MKKIPIYLILHYRVRRDNMDSYCPQTKLLIQVCYIFIFH